MQHMTKLKKIYCDQTNNDEERFTWGIETQHSICMIPTKTSINRVKPDLAN